MPPRKRRQSTHSEDTPKEICERHQPGTGIALDVVKGRASQKGLEGCTPERKLTARQQSRQEAQQARLQSRQEAQQARQDSQQDQTADDRLQDNAMPSTTADTGAKQPTRFSTRVVKRPRRDLSPPESPVKKAGKKAAAPTPVTTPETKGKRTWELWSVEDKDSFFEGLCEFGKDFESIHNLIVSKCRKKGSVMPITVKNKEQVRHFYYRTWHKISKLIEPVEDLKKDIQELYGLISYSVLRKKLRGGVNPNDKNWQKLNELVHQGAATIKVKGKRIRVKTPVCAALKRLNSYEEPKREPGPKLPEKIRVEFRPKTNAAWKQVQDLSQNPRLRVCVKPDRNLQSLIKFLDQKWTPQRLKSKASMNQVEASRQEFRVYPHRESVMQNINLEAVDDPVVHFCLKDHNKEALNISPSSSRRRKEKEMFKDKETCSVNKATASVPATELYSSEADKAVITNCKCCVRRDTGDAQLCNVAEACICKNLCAESGCLQSCCCRCSDVKKSTNCNSCLKQSNEVTGARVSLFSAIKAGEKIESPKKSVVNPPVTVRTLDSDISAAVNGENAMFPDKLFRQEAREAGAGDTVTVKGEISEHNVSDMEADLDSPVGKERVTKVMATEEVSSRLSESSSQSEMERFVKTTMSTGWKVGGDDKLTVAELYLMFGKNGELKLEYEWVSVKSAAEIMQEKLLQNLNNMLRRLSHLATVEFTDFTKTPGSGVGCQLCGQVQGGKQKAGGKNKDCKSPAGKGKTGKTGKDAGTQTQGPLVTKEIPISPATVVTPGQDGVFRVPVMSPSFGLQGKAAIAGKAFVQNINPPPNKPIMRPRKLKPVSRGQARPPNHFGQRTILPKNSQLVTFYPVVAGPQVPGQVLEKNMVSQTIVGHPINGIQSQAVTMTTTVTTAVPSLSSIGNAGDILTTSLTSSQSAAGMMEISMSPDDEHTLMRIPASQVGSMSQEMLQAAGLSALPTTSVASPLSIATTSSPPRSTPVVSAQGSISPPNLSSLLDMSLSNIGTGGDSSKFMDIGDTTFSSLLGDDTNKGLPLDPGLTTPPIRAVSTRPPSPALHSPAVRSLFRASPTPENQWLNGEAPDLSLTSFLESKPISSNYTLGSATISLPLSLFNDCSRDSQSNKIDVDSTLQSMMNESSIDYVKKFADLAEQIAAQSDVATLQNRKTEQNSSVT